MKGKIYKNKLNTTSPNPMENLNTEISSIIPPHSHYTHQPMTPNSKLTSPLTQNNQKSFIQDLMTDQNVQLSRPSNQGMSNFLDQINQQFVAGYENQRNTHESNTNGTVNQILNQMNTPINKEKVNIYERQNQNGQTLKRVVSNPNVTSYKYLAMGENNKEDEFDAIDEGSILDKSLHSNYNYSKFRPVSSNQNGTSNISRNVNNQFSLFDPVQSKNASLSQRPVNSMNSQQHFISTSAYNTPMYNNQNFSPSPLMETSNLMILNPNDNSFQRPNPQMAQSDYINQYEKRHKERVSALESQHELELQFYEDELKTRDETIEEMKKMLKEKEEIIRRLQSENANLSSRSYISFANGNMYGKD